MNRIGREKNCVTAQLLTNLKFDNGVICASHGFLFEIFISTKSATPANRSGTNGCAKPAALKDKPLHFGINAIVIE